MSVTISPVDPSLIIESLKRLERSFDSMKHVMDAYGPREIELIKQSLDLNASEIKSENDLLVGYLIRYLAQTGIMTWAEADEMYRKCNYE